LLPLLDFGFELGREIDLHAEHAHQDQHEGAQQPRHQVGKHGPDWRDLVVGTGVSPPGRATRRPS